LNSFANLNTVYSIVLFHRITLNIMAISAKSNRK
jgi:hypothetical protein